MDRDDFKYNKNYLIELPTLHKEFLVSVSSKALRACMFCVYGEMDTNTNIYKSVNNLHYGYYYDSNTMDIYRWGDKMPCNIYEMNIHSQIEKVDATRDVIQALEVQALDVEALYAEAI